ncbi:MAG: transporter substrate-binding domain-containing protein [Candidatus Ornithospirochaeta sp.]
MKKLIAIALITIAILAPIFASGSKEESSGETVYTVASSCDYPPLEYIDDNGNMVGYEIELLEEIAKATGVKFNIYNVAFDGIIAGIQGGQYDIGASGFTVTEDRAKVVNFTDPDGAFTLSIVTQVGTEGLVDEKSLIGKKVGVQIGTTCQFACEEAGLTVSAYDEAPSAILDLANGNLDAVVIDNVVANDFVFNNESYAKVLKISGSFSNEDTMAIAVSKNKPDALKVLNEGLKAVKESGKLEELKAKYNFYF